MVEEEKRERPRQEGVRGEAPEDTKGPVESGLLSKWSYYKNFGFIVPLKDFETADHIFIHASNFLLQSDRDYVYAHRGLPKSTLVSYRLLLLRRKELYERVDLRILWHPEDNTEGNYSVRPREKDAAKVRGDLAAGQQSQYMGRVWTRRLQRTAAGP